MIETEAKVWHSLPGNRGIETVKLALKLALKLSDGTKKGRLLSTRDLVTEQANGPYCSEVANNVWKPEFVGIYDVIEVSIERPE